MLKKLLDSTRRKRFSPPTVFFSTKSTEEEYTTLDRLLRFKPAIVEEPEDEELEGLQEDDSGEPDPRLKLAKSVLSLGRVYYRHAEPLPKLFTEKQNEVTKFRTAAQIRRCLSDWMLKYDREEQLKFRGKNLIWGRLPAENKKVLHAYGPEETVAYARYYMPSRFIITKRVFKEMKNILPTFKPVKVLDFGCGPATAGLAAYEIWDSTVKKYTGIDISQSMLDAAKLVTAKTIPDCTFWDKSSEIVKKAAANGERYNLIIASYTLADLPDDPSRRAATQILFELLDVGGCLVLVEAGNPKGSHTVRSARQLVLDTFNHVNKLGKARELPTSSYGREEDIKIDSKNNSISRESDNENDGEGSFNQFKFKGKFSKHTSKNNKNRKVYDTIDMILPPPTGYEYDDLGATVIAPCTHDRVCPLASQNQWCAFSQSIQGSMIRKASEEKFSYVVIQKKIKTNNDKTLSLEKQKQQAGYKNSTADILANIEGKNDKSSNNKKGPDRKSVV